MINTQVGQLKRRELKASRRDWDRFKSLGGIMIMLCIPEDTGLSPPRDNYDLLRIPGGRALRAWTDSEFAVWTLYSSRLTDSTELAEHLDAALSSLMANMKQWQACLSDGWSGQLSVCTRSHSVRGGVILKPRHLTAMSQLKLALHYCWEHGEYKL